MATILIVDDRQINRQFLITLLGYRGYPLLEATNGAEAIAIAHNQRRLAVHPACSKVVNAFQSTLPMKGVTRGMLTRHVSQAVSIHTPNEGSDTSPYIIRIPEHVSIHTPNEGSDYSAGRV